MRYAVCGIRGCLPAFMNALEEIGYKDGDELYLLGDIAGDCATVFELFRKLRGMNGIHPVMGLEDVHFQNWLLARRYPEAVPSKAVKGYPVWEDVVDNISEYEIDGLISWIDSWPCAVELDDAFLLYSISSNILSNEELSSLSKKHRTGSVERFRNCLIPMEFRDEMISKLTTPTSRLMFTPNKKIFVGNCLNLIESAAAESLIVKSRSLNGVSVIDMDNPKHAVTGCLPVKFIWVQG